MRCKLTGKGCDIIKVLQMITLETIVNKCFNVKVDKKQLKTNYGCSGVYHCSMASACILLYLCKY